MCVCVLVGCKVVGKYLEVKLLNYSSTQAPCSLPRSLFSKPSHLPELLDTRGYETKVSGSESGSTEEFRLLSPSPESEPLSARAVSMGCLRMSPSPKTHPELSLQRFNIFRLGT